MGCLGGLSVVATALLFWGLYRLIERRARRVHSDRLEQIQQRRLANQERVRDIRRASEPPCQDVVRLREDMRRIQDDLRRVSDPTEASIRNVQASYRHQMEMMERLLRDMPAATRIQVSEEDMENIRRTARTSLRSDRLSPDLRASLEHIEKTPEEKSDKSESEQVDRLRLLMGDDV